MSKNIENKAELAETKENCQIELEKIEIKKTEAKVFEQNEEENYNANTRKSMTNNAMEVLCGGGSETGGGGVEAECSSSSEHVTTTAAAATATTATKTNTNNPTTSDNTTSQPASESHKFLTPAAPLAATSTTTVPPASNTATTNLIKKNASDFVFGKCIGEGSFSSVYLALGRQDRREYAIKVCDKRHILRERKQVYVRRERELLQVMSHTPGFVNLICTFQDNRSLYFVMTYAPNGELFPHIRRVGCFSVECARHYAAELVLACEQMHQRNVVHRDLKPENILLDAKLHTLIADFGSAKLLTAEEIASALANYDAPEQQATPSPSSSGTSLTRDDDCDDVFADEDEAAGDEAATAAQQQQQRYRHKRKGSFVGTAQYVSPEVLQNMPIMPAADLWALGCIIYHMIAGMPPFRGYNDFAIFKEILAANFDFPENFDKTAESLVRQLLKMKPTERLGARDDLAVEHAYVSIRAHEFFAGIDFENLRQQTPPKIQPCLPTSCLQDAEHETAAAPSDAAHINSLLAELTAVWQFAYSNDSSEKQRLLEAQKNDKWHFFTDNEVILKRGLVNRHKGLFTTKLMLVLTTGPQLIYVDPVEMIKKGKIDWSSELRAEIDNRRLFHVHTTARTHFFDVLEGTAADWVAAITKVHDLCFADGAHSRQSLATDSPSSLSLSPVTSFNMHAVDLVDASLVLHKGEV